MFAMLRYGREDLVCALAITPTARGRAGRRLDAGTSAHAPATPWASSGGRRGARLATDAQGIANEFAELGRHAWTVYAVAPT